MNHKVSRNGDDDVLSTPRGETPSQLLTRPRGAVAAINGAPGEVCVCVCGGGILQHDGWCVGGRLVMQLLQVFRHKQPQESSAKAAEIIRAVSSPDKLVETFSHYSFHHI